MPLKLWLPLDGTTENRGASGVTMSGAPASWDNGRTGKCATFNDNLSNVISCTTNEFNYTVEDFSWCMWITRDQSQMTSDHMFAFSVGRPDYGDNRGYGLAVHNANALRFWFGYTYYDITGIPNNEWHHIAFTRKGSTVKLYLDGELYSTNNYTGPLPTYSAYGIGLGCFHYSSNVYPLIGSMSDFRIYNHTLSDKEVYEISRALILHYPLSSPGNANPNLLTWEKNYTEASPLVHTSKAADGYKYLGNDTLITVTPGKTYYVQIKSDKTPRATHSNSPATVSDQFTLWFYIRKIGTAKNVGGYDSTACFTSASSGLLVNDPERHLFVWKWTAPSNAQDITMRTNSYSDGSTSVTIKFWDIKVEEATYTSYIPSVNSPQYGELGYGSDIVRDASGRGNDGKWSAVAPTPVTGSPRYAMATQFNNTEAGSSFITYQLSAQLPKVSLAYWLYIPSGHTGYMSIDTKNTDPGGSLWISANTEGSGLWSYWGGKYHSVWGTLETDTWHHIVFTFDQGTTKWYRNGVQVGSTSTEYSSHTTWPSTVRTIGDSYTGSSWSGAKFTGRLSDYRIYGTVLSDADVKYLYETSAAIDCNGDMFGDSFEETEALPRVGKEGLVYGAKVTESGGTQRLFTAIGGVPVDPNRSTKTFTPTTAQNSTVAWYYFECIPGIQKYHVKIRVDWTGFDNITTTNPNFSAYFQGVAHKTDGSGNEWAASSFTSGLNSHKYLSALAKESASGSYLYDVDVTMSSSYPDTYIGQMLGMRSDYSNGTGSFTVSKLMVYPADEHMTDTASLCSSGAIQARLIDEVTLA